MKSRAPLHQIDMTLPDEKWKAFEAGGIVYEISDRGRARRYLEPFAGMHGKYSQLYLPPRKKVTLHTLVAELFLGPRPEGHVVNHKDGNGRHNDVTNIEYVTPSRNVAHAYEIGLHKRQYGERAPKWIVTNVQREEILFLRRNGLAYAEIARRVSLKYHLVSYTIKAALARGELKMPKRQMRVCYKPYVIKQERSQTS